MATGASKTRSQAFRFTLRTVGPPPSPAKLRSLIEEARLEALRELDLPKTEATVKPPGGFFGAGLEIVYLLHVSWPYIQAAGAAVATGAATEAGKELYKYLAKALRKRDILPSEPESIEAGKKNSKPKVTRKKKGAKAKTK